MKNKIGLLCLTTMALSISAYAQDMGINIVSQESGVNDGNWEMGATTTTILVDICNNDAGAVSLASYRIRPYISVPTQSVMIAPNAQQTGLPAGWTILSNDGATIRFSNGTDVIAPADCRSFPIKLIPVAVSSPAGAPQTVAATMAFANGVAPGTTSGPQTVGNDPSNDNSQTSVFVTMGSPLPVHLESFTGKKNGNAAILSWNVRNEEDFSHYELERSTDGVRFNSLAQIQAENKHTYSYNDDLRFVEGKIYYRLKMVDKNTAFNYSAVVAMTVQESASIVVSPNPAISVVAVNGLQGGEEVKLTSTDGRVLISRKAEGTVPVQLDIAQLAQGLYFITVTDGMGGQSVHKVIKQ